MDKLIEKLTGLALAIIERLEADVMDIALTLGLLVATVLSLIVFCILYALYTPIKVIRWLGDIILTGRLCHNINIRENNKDAKDG